MLRYGRGNFERPWLGVAGLLLDWLGEAIGGDLFAFEYASGLEGRVVREDIAGLARDEIPSVSLRCP